MSGEDDTREYSTVDLRKNLGQALGRAHFQGEVVKISHHGKPYAQLTSHKARVVSNEDADLLEKIEPVKQLIIDKLDDGLDISEIVSDTPASGTGACVVSNEDAQFLESAEPLKKLMLSNGISIVEMVSILEQMVNDGDLGKAARPAGRPKLIAS